MLQFFFLTCILHLCYLFILSYFLLNIFFIYILNVIPFLSFPSENPLSPPPPPAPQHTHSHSWSWHFPILGHRTFTGPRASPPIDDQLGHPLLHMKLEPQVLHVLSVIAGLVSVDPYGSRLLDSVGFCEVSLTSLDPSILPLPLPEDSQSAAYGCLHQHSSATG